MPSLPSSHQQDDPTQPWLDALALMDEHNRLRAKAAVAERLAEALEKIQRSGIEEPYHRNIVRDALAEFRSLSSPADSQEPSNG